MLEWFTVHISLLLNIGGHRPGGIIVSEKHLRIGQHTLTDTHLAISPTLGDTEKVVLTQKQHHRATLKLSRMKQFQCCSFNSVIDKTDTLTIGQHTLTDTHLVKLRRLALTKIAGWRLLTIKETDIYFCRMVISLLQIMMGVAQCPGS